MRIMEKKVVRAPKEKFSWSAEILKIELNGEPLRVDISDAKKIYPLISRELKLKAPEMTFKTDSVTEPGFLLVYRTV